LQINREERSKLIEDEAINSYKETGKLIDNQLINLMHQQAMTDNLFYRITDEEGQVIADTTMMLGMMNRMGMHSDSRSEEHTSELQSRFDLVCRLLLEKKNMLCLAHACSQKVLSHSRPQTRHA